MQFPILVLEKILGCRLESPVSKFFLGEKMIIVRRADGSATPLTASTSAAEGDHRVEQVAARALRPVEERKAPTLAEIERQFCGQLDEVFRTLGIEKPEKANQYVRKEFEFVIDYVERERESTTMLALWLKGQGKEKAWIPLLTDQLTGLFVCWIQQHKRDLARLMNKRNGLRLSENTVDAPRIAYKALDIVSIIDMDFQGLLKEAHLMKNKDPELAIGLILQLLMRFESADTQEEKEVQVRQLLPLVQFLVSKGRYERVIRWIRDVIDWMPDRDPHRFILALTNGAPDYERQCMFLDEVATAVPGLAGTCATISSTIAPLVCDTEMRIDAYVRSLRIFISHGDRQWAARTIRSLVSTDSCGSTREIVRMIRSAICEAGPKNFIRAVSELDPSYLPRIMQRFIPPEYHDGLRLAVEQIRPGSVARVCREIAKGIEMINRSIAEGSEKTATRRLAKLMKIPEEYRHPEAIAKIKEFILKRGIEWMLAGANAILNSSKRRDASWLFPDKFRRRVECARNQDRVFYWRLANAGSPLVDDESADLMGRLRVLRRMLREEDPFDDKEITEIFDKNLSAPEAALFTDLLNLYGLERMIKAANQVENPENRMRADRYFPEQYLSDGVYTKDGLWVKQVIR